MPEAMMRLTAKTATTMPTVRFLLRPVKRPVTAKARSGNNGNSQAYCIIVYTPLPFQPVDLGDVAVAAFAVMLDDEGQTNGQLLLPQQHRRSKQNIPIDAIDPDEAVKRQEVHIDCVQHQFNTHKHCDNVALRKSVEEADGKRGTRPITDNV